MNGWHGKLKNSFDRGLYEKGFNSQNTSKPKLLVFIAEKGNIRFI